MSISAREAWKLIEEHGVRGPVVETDVREHEAQGLVIAQNIPTDRDLPPFNRAMVDGYAIRSSDLNSGVSEFKIIGRLQAGSPETFEVGKGEALEIMTGAPVPESADAVIMYEGSNSVSDGRVSFVRKQVDPFFNISLRGEDLKEGSVAVRAGIRIDNSSLPALSSVGAVHVKAYSRPVVSLVSTGDEVVKIDQPVLPHQIRDGSSGAIANLLSHYGIQLRRWTKTSDDLTELRGALKEASNDSDLVIVTGAVSMGVTDNVPSFLQEIGYKEIFHKVEVKPGKPLWFGVNSDGSAAFGLPGNPVSSQVSLKVFVERWIRKWMGLPQTEPMRLTLAVENVKKHDREEFRQCRIITEKNGSMVEPISHHGSGDIINLVGSHGLLVHPKDTQILEAGSIVDFIPWRDL